jgi:hypothetical protein
MATSIFRRAGLALSVLGRSARFGGLQREPSRDRFVVVEATPHADPAALYAWLASAEKCGVRIRATTRRERTDYKHHQLLEAAAEDLRLLARSDALSRCIPSRVGGRIGAALTRVIRGVDYSLIVSIESRDVEIDLWTPVAQQIAAEVQIET